MTKQEHEYQIWQQGAEARRLDREARQAALLKQELADAEEQQRAQGLRRAQDEERREAANLSTTSSKLCCRSTDLEVSRPRPRREIGSLYGSCAEEMLNLANHHKHICWLLKNAVGNRHHFFDVRRRNTGKHDRGGLES
jgi:hypothetical protein